MTTAASLYVYIYHFSPLCCIVNSMGTYFETGMSPPESHPRENLLVLYLKDGSTVLLCANSEDEAL